MAIPPIPRNPLFRERQVKIAPMHEGFPSFVQRDFPTIILSEVTNVSLSSDSDTAQMMGVRNVVIQPWYFKPFMLEITGKSYIGAFSDRFLPVNVATDSDISKLLALREIINERIRRKGADLVFGVLKDSVELLVSIRDPHSRGIVGELGRIPIVGGVAERAGRALTRGGGPNTAIDQTFRAVFSGVKVDESESPAYMQGYSLKFIAQFADKKSVIEGAKSAKNDLKAVTQFVTGGVGRLVNSVRSGNQVPVLPSLTAAGVQVAPPSVAL